jgi:transposase, IS5 family
MRPRERRETSEQDLFRSRLDQIIDMKHALVKLARAIDWGFLEQTFGAVYTDKPGQPPLPTRLMAGLAILKHTPTTFPTRLCAIAGWRIRTSSTSAARNFSNMRWCLTDHR